VLNYKIGKAIAVTVQIIFAMKIERTAIKKIINVSVSFAKTNIIVDKLGGRRKKGKKWMHGYLIFFCKYSKTF